MADNDQLEQLRALLERSIEGQKTLEAKFDAHRAESAKRALETENGNRRLEDKVDATRKIVGELATRMAVAESDIRGLKAQDTDHTRQKSETDLAHQAAIGGAIAHVRTVDAALGDVRNEVVEVKTEVADVKVEVDKASRIDKAFCQEFGLDYDALANDAEGPAKPKRSTLAKLARENKAGLAASIATIVTLLLQIVLQLLGKH